MVGSTVGWTIPYHGVELPQGDISFADRVVMYDPAFNGGNIPGPGASHSQEALGAPDYTEGPGVDFVSLGAGGVLILEFVDNFLTGSDDDRLDLWIFEIGPNIEACLIWISQNAQDWFSVGGIGGSTSGIDIDAYGFGTSDLFNYVMIQDNFPLGGFGPQSTVGADIDAVAAITTVPIPEPATVSLLGLGIATFSLIRRRRRRRRTR